MKAYFIGLVLAIAGVGIIWLTIQGIFHFGRCSHSGPSAFECLKTLASAEADFRVNDRDKNGKQDFWRQDVVGLYALIPKGGSDQDALKLIDVSVAAADDRPIVDIRRHTARSPKVGYWFRAVRHADEKTLDAVYRFAFCAFPDQYGKSGRWVYILDEENEIYKKDLGQPGGIEVYPLDPLKEGWQKLD